MKSKTIEIISKRIYRGPNIYDYGKGIYLVIDIGDLEYFPTGELPGFTEKLLEYLPSLYDHTCSYDSPGGLIRRMTEDEGTWLGHVFEHVILEVQSLAEVGKEITYGKTRQLRGRIGKTGLESIYYIYFGYRNEQTALAAINLALRLVNYIVDEQNIPNFDYQKEFSEVVQTAEKFAYGPTTGSIVQEAENRGIPTIRLRDEWSLVQFGWGKKQKRIWASTSTNTSYISVEIAQDKDLTSQMLYEVGVPVPKGKLIETWQEALKAKKTLNYPLVTKPQNLSHGRGILLNITSESELKWGFDHAKEFSDKIIIERYIEGNDYRLLVINGRFVAAANRIPAQVIGNGKNTIKELIDKVNADPRRGLGHEKVLTQIKVDEETIRMLEKQGYTLETIPDKLQTVKLKQTANLSTGGTAVDCTDIVHSDNIQLAERAVKTIGLDIAGIDVVTNDISQPIVKNSGVVVEVNAAPGFRMHLEPTLGEPRNVAKIVIDMLFANNDNGRIPIIAITGTNGKTTVTRWVAHTLQLAGYNVGHTTTDGIYINGNLEFSGDCTGPWSAKAVLRDPTIDIAVLETARGGILREGLGWDYCDVGVLLNVTEDHIGYDEINSIDELARVKGIIFDQINDTGIGVINADDKKVMEMSKWIRGTRTMVSLNSNNSNVKDHTKDGGTAVTIAQNGMIQLIKGNIAIPLIHKDNIPATFDGNLEFNMQNALFVVACVESFLSLDEVRNGLSTFTTTYETNPGRMNIQRITGATVILDYGHNPQALCAQKKFINNLHDMQNNNGRKAIVLSLPGDRPDDTIKRCVSVIAGEYDYYFLKDDWDLRGRKDLEVPNLIQKELINHGVNSNQIHIAKSSRSEVEAVEMMLKWLMTNDIVIISADNISIVHNTLRDYATNKLVNA